MKNSWLIALAGFQIISAYGMGARRPPSPTPAPTPTAPAPTPTPTSFNYSALKQLIENKKLRSIEELLQALPNDYKKSYVFVYQSRSLQKGTMEFPRTILFGRDAKLVMTFEGNSSYPRFQNLEIIEWNERASKFQFHTMDFDPPTKQLPKIQENVAMCTSCHRADPRPNWDAYNFWPGVYGSLSRLDRATVLKGMSEYEGYKNFLETNRNAGRYRFLPARKDDFAPIEQDLHTVANGENNDGTGTLTQRFHELNRNRIIRILREKPGFDHFKWVIVWIGACAEQSAREIENYFRDGGISRKDFLKIYLGQAGADYETRVARLKGFNGSGGDSQREPISFELQVGKGAEFPVDTYVNFFYALHRLGIDYQDFATGFDAGLFAMTTPEQTSAARADDLLRGLVADTGLFYSSTSCDGLESKVLETRSLRP